MFASASRTSCIIVVSLWLLVVAAREWYSCVAESMPNSTHECIFLGPECCIQVHTSRKHAKGPPQKYQNEDEPVPMLVLVPVHLGTGTFGVDGTYG